MKRYFFIFKGRVQGVGFRYTALHLARTYRLTGWVANTDDGCVRMEVQGDERCIDKLIRQLNTNHGFIRIDDYVQKALPLVEDEKKFYVRH